MRLLRKLKLRLQPESCFTVEQIARVRRSCDSYETRCRARERLLQSLTPEQRQDYVASGRFLVTAARSGTVYRLSNWGKVESMRPGKRHWRLCVSLQNRCLFPREDNLLALALTIRTDERAFLKTARRY